MCIGFSFILLGNFPLNGYNILCFSFVVDRQLGSVQFLAIKSCYAYLSTCLSGDSSIHSLGKYLNENFICMINML